MTPFCLPLSRLLCRLFRRFLSRDAATSLVGMPVAVSLASSLAALSLALSVGLPPSLKEEDAKSFAQSGCSVGDSEVRLVAFHRKEGALSVALLVGLSP
jgi:hypothetical protein